MGRKVLVTGSSLGIGAATAERFAEPDAVIGVHYNSSEKEAKEVAARVEAKGAKAVLLQGDLSQPEPCERVVKEFADAAGGIDVLVNNAGALVARSKVEEIEWELVDKIFRVNVYSAFLVTRWSLPHLMKGVAPAIVNLGSIAARHGAPTATAYGAAKSALHSFTRGLAKEVAPTVRVNCVAPGVIETPFHERTPDEQMQRWREETPVGFNGEAIDIAEAIHYLCSPAARFITGETLDVNGGLSMI